MVLVIVMELKLPKKLLNMSVNFQVIPSEFVPLLLSGESVIDVKSELQPTISLLARSPAALLSAGGLAALGKLGIPPAVSSILPPPAAGVSEILMSLWLISDSPLSFPIFAGIWLITLRSSCLVLGKYKGRTCS